MSELPACAVKVCHPDAPQNGLIPVFGSAEQNWPNGLRIVLYCLGLLWAFMGVAIISDVFMGAIERITSKKRRRLNPENKKLVTCHIWNATVANLTLMALGSSAPEILLSCIELLTGRFYSGDLGPSTIVGSAAFNLFCISAVCVAAIPDGEMRHIDDLSVYVVTALFSLFAYFWLLVILQFSTPNVVTIPEGIVTFLYFPVLVILAFLADKGYLFKKEQPPTQVLSVDMSPEELAQCMTRIRQQHGAALSDEQVMKLLQVEFGAKPTRAQYRIGATRNILGCGKKVDMKENERQSRTSVMDYRDFTSDDKITVKQETATLVGFSMPRFAVLESVQIAKLPVIRTGNLKRTVSVDYETLDGSAKQGEDYVTKTGTLEFAPNQTEKTVEIEILDDNTHEEDEEFYVKLANLTEVSSGDGPKGTCEFRNKKATVVIIDDDDPGILRFEAEQKEMTEKLENSKVVITVHRVNGCTGKVGCKYETEDGTAIRGADYMAVSGTLEFDNEVMSQQIEIEVISRGRFEQEEEFRVVLSDAFGGASFDESTDGAKDACICTIVIKPNVETKDGTSRMLAALKVNWDKSQLGHANYASQFKDALYIGGEEDEGPPGVPEYIVHAITMPWKLVFALVPPVDFADGWLCFCCSLMMIGGVTYLVGQLATFLGCCMGIADEITAITFVALGTSLPDTFASKTAAVMDEYADASIGNVTGSNSVNVFLGLGLPWMIGAAYWVIVGPNEEWLSRYPVEAQQYPDGIFVVQAASLSFNVLVFTVLACVCMFFLFLRRLTVGGELGGPNTNKYASASFLSMLWLVYIGLSSWQVVANPKCTDLL